MKKILIILTLVTGFISCKNQPIEFADYTYTAGYFPYQYPVRTLVLGDYIYPNENDNNHKFLISAAFGGVYSNKEERKFTVELAQSLCNNVKFKSTNDTIRLMPPAYYTLSSSNITIPAGKYNAGIEVQLTDAFFNDPLAIKNSYVIPLRIVSVTNLDSVLRGQPLIANPDPRIAANWVKVPKDFTMFAVKFINPYHGKYLHRGTSVVTNASATVLETAVYHTQYIVDNEIWSLVTAGKNKVTISGFTHSTLIPGALKMDLTFADNGNCTIAQAAGSTYTITGSGSFAKDADEWGLQKRDAIYLKYQLTSGANTFNATDTLVIRDRGVVMETYEPVVF